eukprot:UN16062
MFGTALSLTLNAKDTSFADRLLNVKANPNISDDKNPPPLVVACKLDHTYLVKKLIAHKADVNGMWIDPASHRTPPSTPLSVSLKNE